MLKLALLALVGEEGTDRIRVGDDEIDERCYHEDQPERGGPNLQCGKHFHAVDHQREDDQRRCHVAQPQRDTEPSLRPWAMIEPSSAKKMKVNVAMMTLVTTDP